MPFPIQFGEIYETEYDAIVDGLVSPKRSEMQDNNEIQADELTQRQAESDLPITWNVADWFFDKPKAPQVAKPNTNVEVSPQERLDGAFRGTRQMESETIGRMMDKRQRENTQAGLLHQIAD